MARNPGEGSEMRCEQGLLPGGWWCDRRSQIVTLISVRLEISHSAVSRRKHRDWGNAAVRHKYISAPSNHQKHTISTGTAKPGKLYKKICQDHYFWEEKIWLGLSWLLGTWLEYTLENAELCHSCISAYGTEINNLILAVNMVLTLLSWIAIISRCLSVAPWFKKRKTKPRRIISEIDINDIYLGEFLCF